MLDRLTDIFQWVWSHTSYGRGIRARDDRRSRLRKWIFLVPWIAIGLLLWALAVALALLVAILIIPLLLLSIPMLFLKRFGRARPLVPNLVGLLERRGRRYEEAGQLEKATWSYHDALLILSGLESARRGGRHLLPALHLARLRRLLGNYRDAEAQLRSLVEEARALGLVDIECFALEQLARLYRELNDEDAAIAHHIELLRIAEGHEALLWTREHYLFLTARG